MPHLVYTYIISVSYTHLDVYKRQPNIHPFSMLIDDKKIYLDISDADWTTRYTAFDLNSDTGELSNYRLIEWNGMITQYLFKMTI